MKRYYRYKVALDTGAILSIWIDGKDIDQFRKWIEKAPGIAVCTELQSAAPVRPFSARETKLAAARIKAGLTQTELANRVGVAHQQISRWESGKFHVKTHYLMRLGEALGVDWLTLIEDE